MPARQRPTKKGSGLGVLSAFLYTPIGVIIPSTSERLPYRMGSQCVEVSGVKSGFLSVSCGVPQGSILGPLLFLIYINDMSISLECSLSLYADNSALFFARKNPSVIAECLSSELTSCRKWLIDNKLSLHVGKTECLLFGTKSQL